MQSLHGLSGIDSRLQTLGMMGGLQTVSSRLRTLRRLQTQVTCTLTYSDKVMVALKDAYGE